MKMIKTTAAVAATQYTAYVHNCLRNRQCEPSYAAPLPSLTNLELYVFFGSEKPIIQEFTLVDICNDAAEQIFPSNFVAGQDPDGNWYGVFKYFNVPVTTPTTFVVHLSAIVFTGTTYVERTWFTEMLMLEPCAPLTKIKSCAPELATTTGFDVNGIYYGLPQNMDYLGNPLVRYFHIAYVRNGKVRELSNKATFKSSLIRNFRTTVEKIHQLETELVPQWYKNVLLAIYARGAISINDGPTYLVSDLAIEPINEDDLTWKPFAQLKETFRLYFGCDESDCSECCSPIITDAGTVSSGSDSESGSVDIPCRAYVLSQTTGSPSAHYIDCQGNEQDTPIGELTTICTNGHGFTISGGGIVVNSFEDGECGVAGNIVIQNGFDQDGNQITDVSPLFFSITSGTFPIPGSGSMNGTHSGFTGIISVTVVRPVTVPTTTLRLIINAVVVECINVPVSGGYSFASVIINPGDSVFIQFFDDIC